MHCLQRAVLRERGCMPADTFVLIFRCVARQNLCETPALAKPPPRCTQAADRVQVISVNFDLVYLDSFAKNKRENKNNGNRILESYR